MIFAHDTEVALAFVTALVNTGGADEQLPDPAVLDALVRSWRWTGTRTGSEAELDDVRALRPRLRRLWEADEDEAVRIVNQLLREGSALPQLVRHDGWDYHLHATEPDAPLAERMAVEATMAVADLIRSKKLSRLRFCDHPDCDSVLVDLSKNRSRRYCDGGCGNRVAVAAYRARRR